MSPTNALTTTLDEHAEMLTATLTIESVPPAPAAQQVSLRAQENGYFVGAPGTTLTPIDFGLGPVGSSAERSVGDGYLPGETGALRQLWRASPCVAYSLTVCLCPSATATRSTSDRYARELKPRRSDTSSYLIGPYPGLTGIIDPICPPRTFEVTGTGFFDRTLGRRNDVKRARGLSVRSHHTERHHTYDTAGTYDGLVTAGSDVFQGHEVSSPFVMVVTEN